MSLILMVGLLFSCSDPDTSNGGNVTGEPGESTTQTENTDVKVKPDLPDVTYDGYEFRFFVRGPEESEHWQVLRNIYTDEIDGEPLNDALYERNRKIEDIYDISISATPSNSTTGTANEISKWILAGDDAYDVIIPGMNQFGAIMMSGVLIDLNELPHIGWDKPWWDQNLINDLSIGGKLYGMMGDICISTIRSTRILMFNKPMITDYTLDDPYTLVRDHKWTLDKMFEMSQNVSEDINGDGVMDINDKYGYLVQKSATVNLFFSAGENMSAKDSDDIPYVSIANNERAVNVVTKIMDILTSNSSHVGEDADVKLMFEEGRGLFFGEVLNLVETMREADINFGIIPVPKYDEYQENYYHFSDSWCMALIGVPKTNSDLSRTSVILEALAAESSDTLVPAFYEINLKGKFFRDTESEEMLELINGTRVISMDEIFGWGMHAAIRSLFDNLSYDVTSKIESVYESTQTNLDKTVNFILNDE